MDTPDFNTPREEGIRLNKYLTLCGYESRRKADQLIAEGVVEINGQRVETPGVRVQPGDYVKVRGRHAQPKEEISLLLNKPRGYVCSREPQGAEGTVYDLLPAKYRHVNYVGRLDTDSEGLLILTNKGELSQHLAHPGHGVEKEYWVTLDQTYENSLLLQLLKGVRIPEGQAKAKYVSRLSPRRACVVLEQGLKRQVRQMFSCLGFRVRKLVRVRIGSLWGGDLEPGHSMILTEEQEKLASRNPAQRKGLISAAQAFPKSGTPSTAQLDEALDERLAREALEAETDYKFNPADFETEEEAEASSFHERRNRWEAEDEEDFSPRRSAFREPRSGAGRRGFAPRERDAQRRRSFDKAGDRPRFRSFRREEDSGSGYRGGRRFSRESDASEREFTPRRRSGGFPRSNDERAERPTRRPAGRFHREERGAGHGAPRREHSNYRGASTRSGAPRSGGGKRGFGGASRFGGTRPSSPKRGRRF